MLIDFSASTPLQTYKILSNTITPRPIAWVSTLFPNGNVNLAPFSFFAPLSANPPILSLCIMQKSDGSQKDTYRNLIDSQRATISMCDLAHLQDLDSSAQELAYNTSEASEFEIDLEILHSDFPPAPKGIQIAFMCELYDILELGESKSVLLLIKSSYIADNIYTPDLNFLPNFIGRVGRYYKSLGARITFEKPKNKPQESQEDINEDNNSISQPQTSLKNE
uniref:Flavin reductase like domain-containing protein n=1 Tax=uncultured Helicobacter sp. TaxID=175537 RepID=A0A650ENL0_9HELI|nr:hypothetical protein Helico5904_1260 [uncultured Helicobacter sp.]